MKKKLFLGLSALGLAAMLFTSCTKEPKAEIEATKLAVEEAKAAGAEMYINELYVLLQDSLDRVLVNLEEENSRFIKNYSNIIEGLNGVTQFAHEVKQHAIVKHEELKAEIQNTINETQILIDSSKQLIQQAPTGKEGTSALVAMKGELATLEISIAQIDSLMDYKAYMEKLDKVKAAKEKAGAVNLELNEVISKYKTNVKNRKA